MKATLSHGRLLELVTYCQETGRFHWLKVRKGAPAGVECGTSKSSNGYARLGLDGRRYGAHRIAWFYVTGAWPKGDVDHIDGDRANNRFANLRAVDRSTNLENIRHARSDNRATGLLGAYRHRSGRFTSRIRVRGQDHHLGMFDSAEEAHAAYIAAKRAMHAGNTL